MAWREGDDVIANSVQTLEFRSKVYGARRLTRSSQVECGNTDRVSRCNHSILRLVVQHPGEHSVEKFRRLEVIFDVL